MICIWNSHLPIKALLPGCPGGWVPGFSPCLSLQFSLTLSWLLFHGSSCCSLWPSHSSPYTSSLDNILPHENLPLDFNSCSSSLHFDTCPLVYQAYLQGRTSNSAEHKPSLFPPKLLLLFTAFLRAGHTTFHARVGDLEPAWMPPLLSSYAITY